MRESPQGTVAALVDFVLTITSFGLLVLSIPVTAEYPNIAVMFSTVVSPPYAL